MDEGVAARLLPRGSDCLRGAFRASDALMRVSVECSTNDSSSCSECAFVSTVRCSRSVSIAKRSPNGSFSLVSSMRVPQNAAVSV